MDFEPTQDQVLLETTVARFATDRSGWNRRAEARARPEGFEKENWTLFGDLGVLALPLSAALGGLAGSLDDLLFLMQAVGRHLLSEPVLGSALLAGRWLNAATNSDFARQCAGEVISGGRRLCVAHEEFSSSGPTNAAEQGGKVTVTGVKTLVLSAVGADAFLVSVTGPRGRDVVVVPATAEGVRRHDYRLVDGSVASDVVFERVPASGSLELREADIDAALDDARLAASAEMVGLSTLLLESTLEYVRTRKQFGVAIGTFQAIQHRLADRYVDLELSRSQLLRSTRAAGARAAAVAACKAFVSAAALRIGRESIQLHGAIGTTDELVVGHAFKRILVLSRLFGNVDSEIERYLSLTSS